jgi:hypothetical protein
LKIEYSRAAYGGIDSKKRLLKMKGEEKFAPSPAD